MLRSIEKNDIPALVELERITQEAPWTFEVFERCWQVGYPGWVIEHHSQVIGFVLISLMASEVHILNLCVHPDFQRQGKGCELLEYALTVAKSKGAGMAFLEVRRSNSRAIALYEKLDFSQIGERKGYYDTKLGREDALVFAKDMGVQ